MGWEQCTHNVLSGQERQKQSYNLIFFNGIVLGELVGLLELKGKLS